MKGRPARQICRAPLPEYVRECINIPTDLNNDVTELDVKFCHSFEQGRVFTVVGHYLYDYRGFTASECAPSAAEAEWRLAERVAADILAHENREISPAAVLAEVIGVIAIIEDGTYCEYESVSEEDIPEEDKTT